MIQLCFAFLFRKSSLNEQEQQKSPNGTYRQDLSGKVGVLKEKLKRDFEVKNKQTWLFHYFL